jgi:hypothetical protein
MCFCWESTVFTNWQHICKKRPFKSETDGGADKGTMLSIGVVTGGIEHCDLRRGNREQCNNDGHDCLGNKNEWQDYDKLNI